jgi:Leucine-rich repeat (LRR) protein
MAIRSLSGALRRFPALSQGTLSIHRPLSVFSKLTDLKNIELNHNPLESLPESLFDLPALEKLHLYKTNLDSVDETRFKNPRIFCWFKRA